MTAVDEFIESTERDDYLTGLLAPEGEEIRVKPVRVGATDLWTAYWVIQEKGYEPALGGQTLRTRWLVVRNGVTDEPQRGATIALLHEAIRDLHETSDVAVPMFPERV